MRSMADLGTICVLGSDMELRIRNFLMNLVVLGFWGIRVLVVKGERKSTVWVLGGRERGWWRRGSNISWMSDTGSTVRGVRKSSATQLNVSNIHSRDDLFLFSLPPPFNFQLKILKYLRHSPVNCIELLDRISQGLSREIFKMEKKSDQDILKGQELNGDMNKFHAIDYKKHNSSAIDYKKHNSKGDSILKILRFYINLNIESGKI